MTVPHLWNTAAFVTHLWQSTAFAALAWMLTLGLRSYPARVRYLVWLSASIKFIVPFSLLTWLGTQWAAPSAPQQLHTRFYTFIEEFNQPFSMTHPPALDPRSPLRSLAPASVISVALLALWLCGCFIMLVRWALQWRAARRLVRNALPLDDGREINALRRAEATMQMHSPIAIVVTTKTVEPGIFGILRPVLLWPAGLSEHLDERQLASIVAHELEHVRRRDNLTTAIHRLIEILFWFHPAIRWMGARMQEERERACDERVVEQSAERQKYAQGILAVCEYCLENPLPCVAGVSGADLKKRVLRIMNDRCGVALTIGRKIVLTAAALLALTLPIGLGIVRGQSSSASNPVTADSNQPQDLPKYEVASIKPSSSNQDASFFRGDPDGISIHNIPVQFLLRDAFGVENDRLIGAPSWVKDKRYDIQAKVAPEDAPKLDKLKVDDRRAMLLPLLVARFNLKYHRETRELPMYALVVAKGGPKLTPSKIESVRRDDDSGKSDNESKGPSRPTNRMMMRPGGLEAEGGTIDMLAHSLAQQLGRTVSDKTGLTGRYDFTLQWTPDNSPPLMVGGPGGPGGPGGSAHMDTGNDAANVSLSTALQEQLGLKLESEKGQVDVIVIDHIDLPSAN